MTTPRGEVRRIGSELKSLADSMERTPVPDDAPVLYEEHCVTIYGRAPGYGGDPLLIEHTCRDDLGVVLLTEGGSPLHAAVKEFIARHGETAEGSEGDTGGPADE